MTRSRSVGAALLALSALPAGPALAADLRVPLDHPTIAAALAGAGAADRVVVQAGTYFENVVLKNDVELRGGYDSSFQEATRDPSANVTILNGGGVGPAVTANAVNSATIVDGFLITGGGGSPGAGILVNGGAPVFTNNEITGNRQAGAGGGVYISGGSTVRFEGNDVHDNSSLGSGGGFHILNSAPVLISNTIEDCVAPNAGGGIYAFNSAVYCSASVMRGNRSGEGGGGAVRIQATSSGARFADCTIDACTSPYGGGILVKDASNVVLSDCDITNCTADLFGSAPQQLGGGLAVFPFCSANLIDVRFDQCSATGGALTSFGGAVYCQVGSITFDGIDATDTAPTSSITGCHADFRGGAMYADSSSGIVQRVLISNCTAGDLGGGLHIEESTFTIQENVIADCSANDGGGLSIRGVFGTSPISLVLNNTIFRCSAALTGGAGGGILHVGLANKNNARIAGNLISHTVNGACVRCRPVTGTGTGSKPAINCTTMHVDPANPTTTPIAAGDGSCSSAFVSDASNRTEDPLFCAAEPFRLQSCSPAVNSLAALNCFVAAPGRQDRGAAWTESHCGCGITSLEPASWGMIKSLYR
ncbi:MAG: right-handed parallel beta-helix repeat-containing protein [Candidatus Eiseniibacteriota bacterium]